MKSQRNKFGKKIAKRIFGRTFLIILFLLFQFILLGVSFTSLINYLQYILIINLVTSFFLTVYIVNLFEFIEVINIMVHFGLGRFLLSINE